MKQTAPNDWQIYCDVGSNHNGDLERAKEIIRQVGRLNGISGQHFAGVKFQLFRAEKLWAPSEHSPAEDVVRERELDPEWIPELIPVAREEGVALGFTAFDDASLDILQDYAASIFFKVSSFDLLRLDFIARNALCARASGRPLHISTGGADVGEIEAALDCIVATAPGLDVCLYHCVSEYPLSPLRAQIPDMVRLDILARKYAHLLNIRIGWSDHTRNAGVICRSMSIFGSVAELHVDLDDRCGAETRYGHCWTISELIDLGGTLRGFHDCNVRGYRETAAPDLRADPVDGLRPRLAYRKKAGKND